MHRTALVQQLHHEQIPNHQVAKVTSSVSFQPQIAQSYSASFGESTGQFETFQQNSPQPGLPVIAHQNLNGGGQLSPQRMKVSQTIRTPPRVPNVQIPLQQMTNPNQHQQVHYQQQENPQYQQIPQPVNNQHIFSAQNAVNSKSRVKVRSKERQPIVQQQAPIQNQTSHVSSTFMKPTSSQQTLLPNTQNQVPVFNQGYRIPQNQIPLAQHPQTRT